MNTDRFTATPKATNNDERGLLMKLTDIDPRFRLTGISEELVWLAPETDGITLHGGLSSAWKTPLSRLPESTRGLLSEKIQALSSCTSGMRLRFRTDSKIIGLQAELTEICQLSHMPLSGSSGFDLYASENGGPLVFRKNFMPGMGRLQVSGEFAFSKQDMRDIVIYLPLYNGVKMLKIGLEKEAVLEKANPYGCGSVVFYGSSITQGGCASRPGNAYPAILSRRLSFDFLNLGFSGNALGDMDIAYFIAAQSPSVLVMDYDHNAPDVMWLAKTHEPFYRAVRERCSSLPVVFMTKPDFSGNEEDRQRREIIRQAFLNADRAGEPVWFIDGESLWAGKDRDSCSVDGCHPNDLGFMRMADRIEPVLQKALML